MRKKFRSKLAHPDINENLEGRGRGALRLYSGNFIKPYISFKGFLDTDET
jgi:hypothetical protein